MPLIDKTLEGELIGIYEKGAKGNRDPKTVGRKTAKAYFNYVKQGKDVGGGTFTAMPGNSQLIQKLGDVYSKKKGNAEDIAKTIVFLINDADYITGQILNVDGGKTLLT